jgi:single-stranded DNA-binding protein
VPEFYEVTCFGPSPSTSSNRSPKGSRAVVVGKGEVEYWTDHDGKPRTTKRILANGCRPDLKWATAAVTKVKAKNRNDLSPDSYPTEEPF